MAGRFPAYTDARACKALKDQILKEQRLRLTSADGVRPATLKEQRMSREERALARPKKEAK